ncbi:hypothetical protein JTB14_038441 [Gonioctena quinquepunctata]|nr:hypothetical protein JTB14_038441 [Gonioctena quinquepunctata]
MRESISARDKLTITLRFLATGESYRSLMYTFRMADSTISLFVPEVCRAIYNSLKEEYLQVPRTAAEWLNISKELNDLWNLPNIIGAIDGKHVVFSAPKSAGSIFFNYKSTHSIVLLALVDANYNFRYIDVGCNGRVSDGGVFANSSLYKAMFSKNNVLNLPEDKPLPGRNKNIPHVLVADGAFPLSAKLIKPYPFKNISRQQRIFNYRLSRVRRVVEHAFGILANHFRVLLTTMNLHPEKVQIITLACCALHNFLKKECPKYMPHEENVNNDCIFKYALSHQGGNRSSNNAIQIREEFVHYVNNEGIVDWQEETVFGKHT